MSRSRTACGLVLAALLAPTALLAQEAIPLAEIERAVLPLPQSDRVGATIMMVENDEARVVREGDGEFICLADAPGDDRFQAACYHRSLEPYMARGRELRRDGMTSRESIAKRQEEIQAGDLEMPAHGMLHQVIAGGDWDGDLATATRLTVIYMPFATAEQLGLPDGRAEGPWVMFSGTATAHIMISG